MKINVNSIEKDIYTKLCDDFSKVIDKKFPSGTSLTFVVYSNDSNCKGEALSSKYLSLPYYNYYSQYSACELYPEHKYCQTWLNPNTISRAEFDDAIADYMEEQLLDKPDVKEEEKSFLDKVADFLDKYKIIVLSVLAVIVVIITTIIVIKRKKRVL